MLCARSPFGLCLQGIPTPTVTMGMAFCGRRRAGKLGALACPRVMLCLCHLVESLLHPLVKEEAGQGGPAAADHAAELGLESRCVQGAPGTF